MIAHTETVAGRHGAVADAIVRSWRNVDVDAGRGAEALYTVDGTFVTPAMSLTGRAEIAAGHKARTAGSPRLSRHVVSNMIIEIDADTAGAMYTLTVYSADGTPPLELKGASAVCDLFDTMRYVDGAWLIARREIVPVFVAPHNDSVMLRGVAP